MPGSALLVAGTTSDAGKSVLTAGLCRALSRRGMRVAPFKAQNMSNNSMVCNDGGEIGRAQWIQAVAARVEPEVAMNPVLLKPGSDLRSHLVVNGRSAGVLTAADFGSGRTELADAAYQAFDDLRGRFEVVIAEGAGSPTETNLRAGDFVNMGLARHADMRVVVVGDIDRGGLLAAMYGTVALLEPADQALIAGFVVNKFRGDVELLRPGLDQLTALTGRPVYGVLPWRADVWLDSEDDLDLGVRRADPDTHPLRVAVLRLPRISNFTDVDALGAEPGLDLRFVSSALALSDADLVVLPGTRATLADLAWMRSRGLDRAVRAYADAGRPVLGVCGGFQILGSSIADPDGVEGQAGAVVPGLGLLDVHTEFAREKVQRLASGTALGAPTGGYELHHGHTTRGAGSSAFLGGARSGAVFGTMWHGSLEQDEFRRAFLSVVAGAVGREPFRSEVSFAALREARLELLADLVDEHLDMARLLDVIASGAPAGLPVVPPGGVG